MKINSVTEDQRRAMVLVVFPSGREHSMEVTRYGSGTVWNAWDDLPAGDLELADRLAPFTPDVYTPGQSFRRPHPELVAAVWAAHPATEWNPRRIAFEALERVPHGTKKEDFLPFVRAVLGHLDGRQARALDADELAPSFALAGDQLKYRADFLRLAGREFDPAADAITRAEVEAIPVPPPLPPEPIEWIVECWECGATYPADQAHKVEDGGMGCARCG